MKSAVAWQERWYREGKPGLVPQSDIRAVQHDVVAWCYRLCSEARNNTELAQMLLHELRQLETD